jgi:imidazolonepropionase-like amidohydrolase
MQHMTHSHRIPAAAPFVTRAVRSVAAAVVMLGMVPIVCAQTWGPQGPPYRAGRPIAIVGGLLIDATGGAPRHDQTVVIQGERIVEVGPMETVAVPAGAEVIDAAGMTVMPGLINSNQHIQLNPLFPSPPANLPLANFKARWEKNWARQPYHAFVYLMQGVTSLRNTSGPAKQIVPVKHAIEAGEIAGPRLFLGAALFQSEVSFKAYAAQQHTPSDAEPFVRDEFAYHVVGDVDRDTKAYEGPDFNFWKLIMSDKKFDGQNDFTDEQLRAFITKAHRLGKKVDVHCGGNNDGLRRMLAFDVDTLEHPFLRNQIVDADIIAGYVKKGVIVDTLLIQMLSETMRAIDPHRFDESIYAMSLDPQEYRILMNYRDRMAANLRKPSSAGVPYYDAAAPPDAPELAGKVGTSSGRETLPADELRKRMLTSKENMRHFIKAGAKFSMGTDTGAFLNFQQEDPNATELMLMVEMGMDPMKAIEAGTRNGAEALGLLKDLGTIEKGKLADVIVVAGNPLQNMAAMKRVAYVVKGGVRYK